MCGSNHAMADILCEEKTLFIFLVLSAAVRPRHQGTVEWRPNKVTITEQINVKTTFV
jgi:hypothetical protein